MALTEVRITSVVSQIFATLKNIIILYRLRINNRVSFLQNPAHFQKQFDLIVRSVSGIICM